MKSIIMQGKVVGIDRAKVDSNGHGQSDDDDDDQRRDAMETFVEMAFGFGEMNLNGQVGDALPVLFELNIAYVHNMMMRGHAKGSADATYRGILPVVGGHWRLIA